MSERIVAALKTLDASNPNHWTAEGLPRLETVRILVGDQAITRADISACAPAFSRTSQVIGEVQVVPTVVAGVTNGLPELDQSQEPVAAKELSDEEVVAELDGEIAALEKEINSAMQKLASLQSERDKFVSRIELKSKTLKSAENIQDYLKTQQDIRAERFRARRALLESGVSLKELARMTQGAPIDVSRRK